MNDMQDFVTHTRRKLKDKFPHPDAEDSLLYTFTELGEVADVLLRILNPDHKRSHSMNDLEACLWRELGDVQFMLCTLANHLGVDLVEVCGICCNNKLVQYGDEG